MSEKAARVLGEPLLAKVDTFSANDRDIESDGFVAKEAPEGDADTGSVAVAVCALIAAVPALVGS